MKFNCEMKKPYFVALDMDDEGQVLELAEQLGPLVGGFKVGPRLLLRYGQSLAKRLSSMAPLFIDHKFYDIPNTMLSSIQASFQMGATFVTVHAAAGSAALRTISQLENELNKIRPFKILVVTVLTSFSEDVKPKHWHEQNIEQTILQMCEEVVESGLTGLVCSPFEAQVVKARWPKLFVVTPGIRLAEDSSDDQKRVMSPEKALSMGADALVIGRTIVNAVEPKSIVNQINLTV